MPTSPRQDLTARSRDFAIATWAVAERLFRAGPFHAHLARQLFEAVSSIGAHLEEGQVAHSRRDMALKYAVALRESRESRHWLLLLASDKAWTDEAAPLLSEADQFVRMLTVSVRKLRGPAD